MNILIEDVQIFVQQATQWYVLFAVMFGCGNNKLTSLVILCGCMACTDVGSSNKNVDGIGCDNILDTMD